MDKSFKSGEIVTVTFFGGYGRDASCKARVLTKDLYTPNAWIVLPLDGWRIDKQVSVLALQMEATK